jgi:hypothetical protein
MRYREASPLLYSGRVVLTVRIATNLLLGRVASTTLLAKHILAGKSTIYHTHNLRYLKNFQVFKVIEFLKRLQDKRSLHV